MALILIVWFVQLLPAAGACYARYIYPTIARVLTAVSDLIPFAVGDLFIALSIAWLVVWPFYARLRRKKPWRRLSGLFTPASAARSPGGVSLVAKWSTCSGFTSGSTWPGD